MRDRTKACQQVLGIIIGLANAAARRVLLRSGGTVHAKDGAVLAMLGTSLTLIQKQLEEHQAPASTAQLQVRTRCLCT